MEVGHTIGIISYIRFLLSQACVSTPKAAVAEKRVRREHPEVLLKGRLMKGKWLWYD